MFTGEIFKAISVPEIENVFAGFQVPSYQAMIEWNVTNGIGYGTGESYIRYSSKSRQRRGTLRFLRFPKLVSTYREKVQGLVPGYFP